MRSTLFSKSFARRLLAGGEPWDGLALLLWPPAMERCAINRRSSAKLGVTTVIGLLAKDSLSLLSSVASFFLTLALSRMIVRDKTPTGFRKRPIWPAWLQFLFPSSVVLSLNSSPRVTYLSLFSRLRTRRRGPDLLALLVKLRVQTPQLRDRIRSGGGETRPRSDWTYYKRAI